MKRVFVIFGLDCLGVTTISEQGTYDELKGSGGTFQQWHEFKTKYVTLLCSSAVRLQRGKEKKDL